MKSSLIPFSGTYRGVWAAGIGLATAYRGFFFLQFGFQLFPLITQLFLWSAVFSGGAPGLTVGGMGKSQMFTYFFMMNLLGLTGQSELAWEMAGAIRQGNLSQFLLKPINYGLYQWHLMLGRVSIELLYLLLPGTILLTVAHGLMVFPAEGWRWAAFLFSVVLGIQIAFLISFLMGTISFWILENSSFLHMAGPIMMLVSGAWFPLSLLSRPLYLFFSNLPFAYQIYFPSTIFLGTAGVEEVLRGLCIQAAWILALGACSVLAWNRGTRAYAAVGG